MSTDNSITPRLIEYMSGALDSELPANVLVKTKHHILDTLSAMISGSVMHPGSVSYTHLTLPTICSV